MTKTQIEIGLGLLSVLIASTIFVVLGLREQDRMETQAARQLAEQIEVGAELFEANCSGCHGNQGRGVPLVAPALNDPKLFTDRLQEVGWEGTLEDYIVSTISSGRRASTRPELYQGQGGNAAMPAWSQDFGGPLRPDQVQNIAKYVLNFEKTAVGGVVIPTSTPVVDDPVARGRAVYEATGCGACHAIDGVSVGVVGPNQNNIGEVAATRQEGVSAEEYIRTSILNPNAYLVEGFNEGIMPQNYGDIISPQELDDLVAYLLTLK